MLLFSSLILFLAIPLSSALSNVTPKSRSAASTAASTNRGNAIWVAPSQNVAQRRGKVFGIQSAVDLLDFMIEDERISVVKVYASWCITCKKFDVRYRKIANQFGDKYDERTGQISEMGSARFAEMQYDNPDNKEICDVMGVTEFPYILVFKGSKGKVDGFQCMPQKSQELVNKIRGYLAEDDDIIEQETKQQSSNDGGEVKFGKYDGKLWDQNAKKDVYNQWNPSQPRSTLNFNPFETFNGNSCDASGMYPGDPYYKEPFRGNNVDYTTYLEEQANANERAANPKPGSGQGCPGCKS